MTMLISTLRCLAACMLACALAGWMRPALAAVDNLDLPAKHSVNAGRALMVAVTVAGTRLVAVGERGIILVSSDGARTWKQAEVPVSVTLTAVHFASASQGWAVGHDGVVLHSADGGLRWARQFDGRQANALVRTAYEAKVAQAKAELAAAPVNARAASQTRLEESQIALADATAGESFGPYKPLLTVWFKNDRQGYVAGAFGQLFRTGDGGKSWEYLGARMGNPGGLHLNAMTGSGSALLLAAESGKLFRSDDEGATWRMFDTGYNGPLYGVLSHGSARMDELLTYGFGGRIFKSTDGGIAWTKLDSGLKASLVDAVVLANGGVVIAGQDGTYLYLPRGAGSFDSVAPTKATRISGLAPLPGVRGALAVGPGGIHAVPAGGPN